MILRIHTYAGLLVFVNFVLYAVVGTGALAGAGTGETSPPLGVYLLVLAASGLWLWWKLQRERRTGTALFGMGAFVAGRLIW